MKVKINEHALSGTIDAPPSKSAAHRIIIAAALADGVSEIKNVALSDDIAATLECVGSLLADITYENGTVKIVGGRKKEGKNLFANESGSTLRFILPLCLDGNEHKIEGAKRLFERPLSVYEEIFSREGILFEKGANYAKIRGRLKGGKYKIPGDISSQFITGLLFALPLCDNDSEIEVIGNFESKSYVMMTLDTLADFGIKIVFSDNKFKISAHQSYKPYNTSVEGDWSNAAFFEALNLFGSSVKVGALSDNSRQGDKVCCELFEKIKKGNAEISIADCPDLAPILFVAAAGCKGATFYDTRRLKMKESDRASVMAAELSKMGAMVKVEENKVTVFQGLKAPDKILSSHNDHRVAMALSVALTAFGGEIDGAEAVKKSMPDFYEKLKKLGAEVTKYDA